MSPPPLLPPQLFRPPKIHQVFRRISANPSPCLSDPAALALDSPCDGSIGVLNGARSQGSVVTPRPAAGSRGSAAGGLGGLSGGSPASAAGVQFSSLQAPSSAVVRLSPVDLSLQGSQPKDGHHDVPAFSEPVFNATVEARTSRFSKHEKGKGKERQVKGIQAHQPCCQRDLLRRIKTRSNQISLMRVLLLLPRLGRI
jgi:hypothetical protein